MSNEVGEGVRYVCPCCQHTLTHTETRSREGTMDGGIVYSYDLHFECMTCSHIMAVVVNVPNPLKFRPIEDGMFRRRDIYAMNNRDEDTTWIWLNREEYIVVNPHKIMANMIENTEQ